MITQKSLKEQIISFLESFGLKVENIVFSMGNDKKESF